MCLIIMQPSGVKLPQEHLDNGWSNNPDGAGYMFVADGKLIIRKGYFKLKELKAAYLADHATHGESSPFVIHFRYATHGEKTADNCHPHSLSAGNVGLVHNGILHEFLPSWDSTISDTVNFCRIVLAYRCAEHLVDATFNGILKEMIGSGNKLVLLSNAGTVSIVNEEAGLWDNGIWYSGTSYKAPSVFGKFKRSTGKSYSGKSFLPAAYAEDDSLFGGSTCGDVWDKEKESREDELLRLSEELNDFDVDGWDKLTPAEQDLYVEMYHRTSELERQLDSRLH